MDIKELQLEIRHLLSLGREGGYWDFKKQWHSDKGELLLDIICMANNIEDKDAYLIFGITDAADICGVENDEHRLNLNNLSNIIQSAKFALYHPQIDIQTIKIDGKEIDVVIIKNTNRTPYYLETNYPSDQQHNKEPNTRQIKNGVIYVRINDGKYGTCSAAPLYAIEYLWRKRFGINLSVMERLSNLLDEYDNWVCDWGNKDYAYHKMFPEFRIQQNGQLWRGWMPAAAFYIHPTMYLAKLNIMYHSTVIFETELWVFDEYRKYLPKATTYSPRYDFWYCFYDLSTIEGKLFTVFTNGTNDLCSREKNFNQILIFNNNNEKENFDKFLNKHFGDFSDDEISSEYQFPIYEDRSENCGGKIFSAFQVAKAAKIYELWLENRTLLS